MSLATGIIIEPSSAYFIKLKWPCLSNCKSVRSVDTSLGRATIHIFQFRDYVVMRNSFSIWEKTDQPINYVSITGFNEAFFNFSDNKLCYQKL